MTEHTKLRRTRVHGYEIALATVALLILAGGVQHSLTAVRIAALEQSVDEHHENQGVHSTLVESVASDRRQIEQLQRRQGEFREDLRDLDRDVSFSCTSESEMREIVRDEIRAALAARGIGRGVEP